MKLAYAVGEKITNSILALVMLGFIASALGSWGIYLIRPVESMGALMAWLCVNQGSCDYNTNLVSFAVAFYILISLPVLLAMTLMADWPEEEEEEVKAEVAETVRSRYYEVLNVIKSAGVVGASSVEISKATGYDIDEVHRVIDYLKADGEAKIVASEDHVVRYAWGETEGERAYRFDRREQRKKNWAAARANPRLLIPYLVLRFNTLPIRDRWVVIFLSVTLILLAVMVTSMLTTVVQSPIASFYTGN